MEDQADYTYKKKGGVVDSMATVRIDGYEDIFSVDFICTTEELLNWKEAGVYCFSIFDKPYYIGQSRNLGARIISSYDERFCMKRSFFSDNKSRVLLTSIDVQYIKVERLSDLFVLESYLIATMKPKLNKQGTFDDLPSIKIDVPAFSRKIKVVDKLPGWYMTKAIKNAKNDTLKQKLESFYMNGVEL